MKAVKMIAWVLVIVGGLNWGLIGFFNFDLVATIFAGAPMIAKVVYALVGLSALMMIFYHKDNCKGCKSCGGEHHKQEGRESSQM